MKTNLAAAALTAGVAVAAFALSQVIWPNPPGTPAPPAGVLPFLLVVAILESLAFGMGVAFLVFGARLLARAGQPSTLTYATYVAIPWSLLNWWPHDNFHRAIGNNFVALVGVIWAFHLTLIITATVVAYFFLRVLASSTRPAFQVKLDLSQSDPADQHQAVAGWK